MKKNKVYVSNYISINTTVDELGTQHLINSVVLASFNNSSVHTIGPLYIENSYGNLKILVQTLDGYDLCDSEYIIISQQEISISKFKEILNSNNAKYLLELTDDKIIVMEYNEKNSF